MTQAIPSLSIFIIARNEADRIGRTIDAVRGLSDDIVVIDSHSTDDTRAVAEAHGARVILHTFEGYGRQKRFGESQCRHPWLLNLDADEVVPPDLAQEIKTLFAQGEPKLDAYTIRIAEIFPGEGAPHPLTYALTPVRLWHRDKGTYSQSPVHDRVDLVPGAQIGKLKGTIHHFSVRSLGAQIDKLNAYTDDQVSDLEARGLSISPARMVLEFPLNFIKAYVLRRHALRGAYGFMTAMNYAFYRYLRAAKSIERKRLRAQQDKSL
jgi:glycosyltransferase involved in cell wall biosynthesis